MDSNSIKKIRHWVRSWERKGYEDGIPDEAPETLEDRGRVPSYRMICKAIMMNDQQLETLGFNRVPCQAYLELKRIELQAKGKPVSPLQGRLL